nr:T9SS type A sorting domain-containing protein [uncultured Flavobacterium sp.]
MRKIYFLIFSLFAISSFGQTIYSENFGTPTATTLITAYTGWQVGTPITYSGSGDVRTSSASSGYVGASGNGNVFLTSTAGKNLIISGINTSAYTASDIQLSFGYVTNSTATQLVVEKSTDGTTWTPITFTNNTTTSWNLVTIPGGQIPSSSTLSLRFTQPATAQMRVDDIKLAAVSASCTLALGTPVIACAASTSALDNYTVTIPYTGGGNATYTVTTTGTVTGDNPSTTAAGNIIITMNESSMGTYTVTVGSGPTCSFTFTFTSPDSCIGTNTLPVNEPFNYSAGTPLNFSQMWKNTSVGSDEILATSGNLTYTGITSTGNSVSFAGTGSDTLLPFTDTTSGEIYASFLAKVTDLTNISLTGSTYFASFSSATNVFSGRIWIKTTDGTQYQYGISTTTTAADIVWSSTLYAVNSTQYLVLRYDFSNNLLALYENPTIGGTAGPSVVTTPATALTSVANFVLRQDSATTTPAMTIDELTITTTPNFTLGNDSFSQIEGLKLYPNPVKGGILYVETALNNNVHVTIYDIVGKQVLNTTVTNNAVNVSELTSGVYVVTVTEEGKTTSKKLMITN